MTLEAAARALLLGDSGEDEAEGLGRGVRPAPKVSLARVRWLGRRLPW